jgi:hypothetical protein
LSFRGDLDFYHIVWLPQRIESNWAQIPLTQHTTTPREQLQSARDRREENVYKKRQEEVNENEGSRRRISLKQQAVAVVVSPTCKQASKQTREKENWVSAIAFQLKLKTSLLHNRNNISAAAPTTSKHDMPRRTPEIKGHKFWNLKDINNWFKSKESPRRGGGGERLECPQSERNH